MSEGVQSFGTLSGSVPHSGTSTYFAIPKLSELHPLDVHEDLIA